MIKNSQIPLDGKNRNIIDQSNKSRNVVQKSLFRFKSTNLGKR